MVIILIASHINDIKRITTLQYALKSIENNTVKPEAVYLSISFDSNIINENEIKKLSQFNVIIDISYTRKLQFEHYHYLCFKYVSDNDIVTFLDDDDLLDPKKIETINKFKHINILRHKTGLWYENKDDITHTIPKYCDNISNNEYFNLAIKGSILKDWFVNTKKYCNYTFEELIKRFQGFTDIMFSKSFEDVYCIDDILYYQRLSPDIKKKYNL